MFQHIENVRTLAGETVTISFWAKAGSGTPKIGVSINQDFQSGSGGSTTVEAPNMGTVTLTNDWTKYYITGTIPSITGKTIGTSGDDSLQVYFWLSSGTSTSVRSGGIGHQNNTAINMAMLQIEKGTVATDFEWLNMAEVVAQCQRFYEVAASSRGSYSGQFMGVREANYCMFPVKFATTKRKIPTLKATNGGNITGLSTGLSSGQVRIYRIAESTPLTVNAGTGAWSIYNTGSDFASVDNATLLFSGTAMAGVTGQVLVCDEAITGYPLAFDARY
jgi:hypothetical protein